MAIKELLLKAGQFLIGIGSKVVSAFMAASIVDVAKAGIFIGCAAFTVYLIVKHFRDKKKMEAKTALEKSLKLNYQNEAAAERLHPKMKKVKKSLIKGAGKRGNKTKNSEIDKVYRELSDSRYVQPVLPRKHKRKHKDVPVWADPSVGFGDIIAGVE